MTKKQSRVLGIILIVLVLIALAVAGRADYQEEAADVKLRQEMELLWHQTNGELGWPPLKG